MLSEDKSRGVFILVCPSFARSDRGCRVGGGRLNEHPIPLSQRNRCPAVSGRRIRWVLSVVCTDTFTESNYICFFIYISVYIHIIYVCIYLSIYLSIYLLYLCVYACIASYLPKAPGPRVDKFPELCFLHAFDRLVYLFNWHCIETHIHESPL